VRQMKTTESRDPAAAAGNPMCDRIVGAAFRAFMELGYTGTSMLEIATRAKVSKRDLYANFASKQAILLACVATRAVRMRLPPDLPEPSDRQILGATLATFGATVVREVSQPEVLAMFRLAIAEAERSPEVAETLNRSRSINRGVLAGLLAQAQARGILGPGDPGQMTEQYFALLWGDLMLSRLFGVVAPPKPAEIGRRAQVAAEAFLRLYGRPAEAPL
jgi:AcrR family transcriptional regulator